MGPVWAYWAFPMERYCGDVLRNIRSRRLPYASINRYVTSRAQLTHITLLYNLDEKLCLQPPTSHNRNLTLPLCMSSIPQQIHKLTLVSDPLYVLTPPARSAESIDRSMDETYCVACNSLGCNCQNNSSAHPKGFSICSVWLRIPA